MQSIGTEKKEAGVSLKVQHGEESYSIDYRSDLCGDAAAPRTRPTIDMEPFRS